METPGENNLTHEPTEEMNTQADTAAGESAAI